MRYLAKRPRRGGIRSVLNPAKTLVCSNCGHEQGESKGKTCEACHEQTMEKFT
jgi:predicted Zn-ribbon and HTH transcriptional regulator